MKTVIRARDAVRIEPCHYGLSRIAFRGPRRPTDGRYVAFLGGSETFAKFVPTPYPALVETAIGEVCVNLGCQSAGPDVFLNDTALQALVHDAAVTVLQVPGAANLSNRYYRVHPRRNDRFIAPTKALTVLFPEIDFTEFAFTGHLLDRLRRADAGRFADIRAVLEHTWLRRMKAVISQCGGPVILLWLASRTPDEPGGPEAHPAVDPIFVRRPLLEKLRPHVADLIEVVAPHGDTKGMAFAELDAFAAREMLGLAAHAQAAKALRHPLQMALL